MSKYGNGITFGEACMHEKEEIRHALNGEVLESWDDYTYESEEEDV